MRVQIVDELEERRVARRLTRLSEAIEPLSADELHTILNRVAAGVPACRLRARASLHVPGIAAAVAAALAIAVGIGHSERTPGDSRVPGAALDQPLSFPEGSALELLLAGADAERPA